MSKRTPRQNSIPNHNKRTLEPQRPINNRRGHQSTMSEHIEGLNRNQTYLLPETLEQYVDQDNPARFIDAFTEHLNRIPQPNPNQQKTRTRMSPQPRSHMAHQKTCPRPQNHSQLQKRQRTMHKSRIQRILQVLHEPRYV
jgi:hypothetical protein